MKNLDQYVITLDIFGKFEVEAENIFKALETIKDLIKKNNKGKAAYLKTTEIKTLSAFVISHNHPIEITDYI